MTVTIDALNVFPNDSHSQVIQHTPELVTRRSHFWGVQGTSEILSDVSGTNLMVSGWFHNTYATFAEIKTALFTLDQLVGSHGDLVLNLANPVQAATYPETTLERIERVPLGNQQEAGIVFDWAGTVDSGWFCPVNVYFRQIGSLLVT